MSQSTDSVVLEIKNLSKNYGKNKGIENVSLQVETGEIFGFIGPNGAGKSTTIRTVMGLIRPDAGQISLFGENSLIHGDRLRRSIGFVPSELNFYEDMKVKGILEYSARFYGDQAQKNISYYCEMLQLDLNRNIRDLSLGNRKKVAIAQALLHQPQLIILDEPTSGLDPLVQARVYKLLKKEQQRGCTVFFSSHTLSEVEKLCSRVAIIKDGTILQVSEMDQLGELYLKRFKLGLSQKLDISLVPIQGISEMKEHERSIEGYYSGDIQDLLKFASLLPLEDMVLENPSLEEVFMHYYDEGEKHES